MFVHLHDLLLLLDVEAEKQHQGFVSGIEKFDKTKLSHAEPDVKNPLPDSESMYFSFFCTHWFAFC